MQCVDYIWVSRLSTIRAWCRPTITDPARYASASGQLDVAPGPRQAACPSIELEIGETQGRLGGGRLALAAKVGANPGQELGYMERFRDIVVGPQLETPDAVVEIAPSQSASRPARHSRRATGEGARSRPPGDGARRVDREAFMPQA
jgi:hypothetical protein